MTIDKNPETLSDLLRTLERSGELRTLARECGLSVRELRRRLAIWRRELKSHDEDTLDEAMVKLTEKGEPRPARPGGKGRAAGGGDWPELISAGDIPRNPMPAKGSDIMVIHTDGASRGNPGPAAVGVVFSQKDGPELAEFCATIGKATNNVAEYRAVVAALEHCQRWKVKRVHLYMDSELIVRQMHGVYRVKSPDLRPLYQQASFLAKGLREFKVKHVKRAQNGHADALANKALDV